MADSHGTAPTKPTKLPACPYTLPEGVKLLRYEPKARPVAVTVCSVVVDVDKFIRHALGELDARLHNPVQIKGGDSVFELISKLGDCGLEVKLEWLERVPEETESADSSGEQVQITDEVIPF